jgi:hypothetical protein
MPRHHLDGLVKVNAGLLGRGSEVFAAGNSSTQVRRFSASFPDRSASAARSVASRSRTSERGLRVGSRLSTARKLDVIVTTLLRDDVIAVAEWERPAVELADDPAVPAA